MTDSLGTYLHDHLAGAKYAIDLVEFMREQHSDDDLGRLAAEILPEIKQDRDTLRRITERGGSGDTLKEAAAWVGEKVGRIKLGYDSGSGLATFEALEFLALGIHGKLALWRALQVVAPADARLAGTDFNQLAMRAQSQHDRVNLLRLRAARVALGPDSPIGSPSSSQTNVGWTVRKGTVVGSIAITVGVLLAVVILPDISRYMKIRAM